MYSVICDMKYFKTVKSPLVILKFDILLGPHYVLSSLFTF